MTNTQRPSPQNDLESNQPYLGLNQFRANPIIRCLHSMWRNKYVTAISMCSTAANALYAFTFPSGAEPQGIGREWWNTMTTAIQIFSVVNACNAIIVNMLINAKYLPLAGEKLKRNLTRACESPSIFIENLVCLLIAASVGGIYGAQSYNAFLWTSILFRAISGLSNFLSYAARRYNGLIDLVGDFKNIFNSNRKFQKECLNLLKQVKAEYVKELEEQFIGSDLNEETVNSFLTALFDKEIDAEAAVYILQERTCSDHFKESALAISKLSLGVFCAPSAFCVGMQNAKDGLAIITNNQSDNWSYLTIFSLALIPSLANAAFYEVSGAGCIETLQDMWTQIQDNKKQIFVVLFALILNALCATAYFDIAKETEGENNILGIHADTVIGNALNYMFLLAAFFTGIDNTNNLLKTENPKVKNIGSITRWLERNKLSDEHIATLLPKHAIFKSKGMGTVAQDRKLDGALTDRLLTQQPG